MWKVMKACVSRCWGITWHCLLFPFFQFFSSSTSTNFLRVRFHFSFNSIYVICISKIDLVEPLLMLPLPLSLLYFFCWCWCLWTLKQQAHFSFLFFPMGFHCHCLVTKKTRRNKIFFFGKKTKKNFNIKENKFSFSFV